MALRTPGSAKGAGVRASPSAPHMPGCREGEQRAPRERGGIKLYKLPLFAAEPLRAIRARLRRAA